MKYAIIAAGDGARLAAEGIGVPKPLVEINGEQMIDRLIRIFMQNGADEIVVICNEKATRVAQHLADIQNNGLKGNPVPLRFVVKSTPSSMHSFAEISRYVAGERFIMTTVDTIFPENEFSSFVDAFSHSSHSLFPVTGYADDEKPLYVKTDGNLRITAFSDTDCHCPYVSAGIYGLMPDSLLTLAGCMERGESRMRNFQWALLSEGHAIVAFPMSVVFDVDHASDIQKAQSFLKS